MYRRAQKENQPRHRVNSGGKSWQKVAPGGGNHVVEQTRRRQNQKARRHRLCCAARAPEDKIAQRRARVGADCPRGKTAAPPSKQWLPEARWRRFAPPPAKACGRRAERIQPQTNERRRERRSNPARGRRAGICAFFHWFHLRICDACQSSREAAKSLSGNASGNRCATIRLRAGQKQRTIAEDQNSAEGNMRPSLKSSARGKRAAAGENLKRPAGGGARAGKAARDSHENDLL